MASGRFDGRKIVYLAGKKARERGRDKNITDPRRYDKLEVFRRKMAECQVNFLASPEDNPEIMEGKKEEWNKIKMEYDDLIQMGFPVEWSVRAAKQVRTSNRFVVNPPKRF